MIAIFIAANAIVIVSPGTNSSYRDIQNRLAQVSIVNLAPLCLGGRAPIIDALNLSWHHYMFFHQWCGFVAVVEALIHVIMAVKAHGSLKLSGWIVSLTITLLDHILTG